MGKGRKNKPKKNFAEKRREKKKVSLKLIYSRTHMKPVVKRLCLFLISDIYIFIKKRKFFTFFNYFTIYI